METRIRAHTIILILLFLSAAALLPAARHTIVLPPIQLFGQANADMLAFDQKFKSDVAAFLENLSARDGFEHLFGDHVITAVTETQFSEGSIFSAFKPGTAAYLLNRYESDMLVLRRYRRIGEFVNLEVYSFRADFEYTRVFSRIITDDNVDDMLKACRIAVLEHLTGVKTGTLVIDQADQFNDRIRIDDQLFSPTEPLLAVLPSGTYTLESVSSRKTVDSRQIVVSEGKQTVFTFPSLVKQTSTFNLVTYPHGALLSVEGRDIGRTPLSFTLEGGDIAAAVMTHEQFEYSQNIGLRAGETVLTLRPDWLQKEDRIAYAQKAVYTHLGLTIATLPISIISMFMYDITGRSAWQIGSTGGAAVSSLLFVQTLYSIADYYHSLE
jgi:hypothetical protein